ncbi:MAG: response regulator transcription factor [Planctomycetota bacterium]
MERLIAIVDDEPDIRELVAIHLRKAHFEVVDFEEAGPFRRFLKQRRPDLVILDLMLPDADGMELCRELRASAETANLPVIMLTAKGEETDRVLGLELGADDYVTKPFSPKELVARVKAVLRRPAGAAAADGEPKTVIRIAGRIVIDPGKFTVTVDGKKADLTTTEFRILELLARRPGWVQTRDKILDHLWGNDKIVLDRTIDVHIRNLREKLGKARTLITNIRGVGYKLDAETDDIQ